MAHRDWPHRSVPVILESTGGFCKRCVDDDGELEAYFAPVAGLFVSNVSVLTEGRGRGVFGKSLRNVYDGLTSQARDARCLRTHRRVSHFVQLLSSPCVANILTF